MKRALTLLLMVGICFVGTAGAADGPPPVTAGTVLEVMFDKNVSEIKSKGLLQRKSLFDLLPETKKHLQLAFVIDGTDSMGTDIDGVMDSLAATVSQLHRHKGGESNVSFSLVIYRDANAEAGRVQMPFGERFTSSLKDLHDAVDSVETETGSPYFNELVDLGLYTAIDELDWRDPDQTSRWIILFGDAPPYKEEFQSKKYNTRRYYATRELIQSAKAQQITVSCILCSSGFAGELANANADLRATYDQTRPQTEEFMKRIALGTQGVFWNLADEELREKVVDAVNAKRANEQAIAQITPADLAKVQDLAERSNSDLAPGNRVRLAILPHTSFDRMSFEPENPAVLVAAEMRNKFRLIPRVQVANPTDVYEKLQQRKGERPPTQKLLQELGFELGVDYLVWGEYQPADDTVKLTSAIYKKIDGGKVAEVGEATRKDNELGQRSLVFTVAERLAYTTAEALEDIDPGAAQTFAQIERNNDLVESFSTPLSENYRAAREILAGFESLEQALGYPKGDPESAELLQTAVLKLNAAASLDPQNPFVYSLLASAYYNQAEVEKAEDRVQHFLKALQKAYANRENATDEYIRKEIEADYALLIDRNAEEAAQLYQSLITAPSGSQIHIARRAHWMLAGIYCGDWGVGQEFVDPEKAREHMMAILAFFPDSPEAAFYKRAFQWDENDGTQHPYYPKENEEIPDLAQANR